MVAVFIQLFHIVVGSVVGDFYNLVNVIFGLKLARTRVLRNELFT